MEGTLSKWTNVIKKWQYRWFVLDGDTGYLSYYTSKQKMIEGSRRGFLKLEGAVIGVDDEDGTTFSLTGNGKTLHFQAKNSEEREKWVQSLESIITGNYNKNENFDTIEKKIKETEAFITIAKNHIKNLHEKLDTFNIDIKTKCNIIFMHANNFMDEIEEGLKFIKLAKNLNGNDFCSSSDDEYYDASENACKKESIESNLSYIKTDGSLDYDLISEPSYDVNVIETQGTVVTHLISQVKIGMDLTKVVLPTFILASRSLLEMYADYFAHPNMFIEISEKETPKERMVQVIKWYLCSYDADNKSNCAKKPYNPILGEIFQCYWDLNGDSEININGPVPWSKKNQVCFIAEQVSHHPPISAFYAENYDKKISFNAYIWTKSKFLGLSIGVHNIGQGIVNVLKYDEEYILNFPSGYGRSILTVPWIELGGKVEINCPKTGYKADINFLTKPFYGGKKHRVVCNVFEPNNKKPFLEISGFWNGILDAKWSNGTCEQLADVSKLNINKKIVRPINQQENNESRNLWKEVTAGLKLNNIEKAGNAKAFIEEKQRLDLQERINLGSNWETKYFKKDLANNWNYINPLKNRLEN